MLWLKMRGLNSDSIKLVPLNRVKMDHKCLIICSDFMRVWMDISCEADFGNEHESGQL
jgi:hypothetical protein